MDACMDLKKDIRRKRYNPLILYPSSGYGDMLNLLMADCTSGYEALGITENKNLIENILFSGIWIKYELTERKKR